VAGPTAKRDVRPPTRRKLACRLRQEWFSDCGKNGSEIAAKIVQTAVNGARRLLTVTRLYERLTLLQPLWTAVKQGSRCRVRRSEFAVHAARSHRSAQWRV